MRKSLQAIGQHFPIQPDPLLLNQTFPLVFAGHQTGCDQHIEDTLAGLEGIFGHLIRDVLLLKQADEGLLCGTGFLFSVENRANFKRELHFCVAGM